MRRITRVSIPTLALAALVLAGCAADTNPVTDLAAEERAIRAVDRRMLAAAQGNDPSTFGAAFTEDGRMLFPNMDAVVGREAITAKATEDFAVPGFTLSWQPTHVEIARSGDLAVSSGTYELALTTPGGPVEDRGKYMTVWRKVDGEWKVAADMMNTSVPLP